MIWALGHSMCVFLGDQLRFPLATTGTNDPSGPLSLFLALTPSSSLFFLLPPSCWFSSRFHAVTPDLYFIVPATEYGELKNFWLFYFAWARAGGFVWSHTQWCSEVVFELAAPLECPGPLLGDHENCYSKSSVSQGG